MKGDDPTDAQTEFDRLRARERRAWDFAASVADWYWEADAHSRFTVIAEEAREFGIDPARLIALDRFTAEEDPTEVARSHAILTRQRPFRDLTHIYDWEGFPLVVALYGTPVRDAQGRFQGYRGCARDMTQLSSAGTHTAPGAPTRRMAAIAVPTPRVETQCAPDSAHRRLDILVVEDDAVNRLVIGGFLTPHGHTVSFAHDGEQGVARAKAHRYDLILMDVMMPGMDGPSATRVIRALPAPLGEVPIIALTANAMEGDRERYLADGMTDYVTKPINRGLLFRTIERVTGGKAFATTAEAPAAPAAAPNAAQAALLDALTDTLDL